MNWKDKDHFFILTTNITSSEWYSEKKKTLLSGKKNLV